MQFTTVGLDLQWRRYEIESETNTSSLTKQRQKQWQKLIVIPLFLQNKDKNNDRS